MTEIFTFNHILGGLLLGLILPTLYGIIHTGFEAYGFWEDFVEGFLIGIGIEIVLALGIGAIILGVSLISS